MFKRTSFLVALTMGLFFAAIGQGMEKKATHETKVLVILTHEVKDYATWKKGYDADEGNRKKAGFLVKGVYADVKNPNIVSVVGEFPSSEAADAFVANPKLKEVMEKAGVIGIPDMKILTIAPK